MASRQIRRRLLGKSRAVLAVPAPANRELFNSEQRAAHGKVLAAAHVLSLRGKQNRLDRA